MNCHKWKTKTENVNPEIVLTTNGLYVGNDLQRAMLPISVCASCHILPFTSVYARYLVFLL